MKIYILFNIGFLLFTLIGFAQQQDVELLNSQNDKEFIISAKNNSNIQQEITVTLEVKNVTGYSGPITKLVKANDSLEIVRLTYLSGKQASYASNYMYKPAPTDAEIARQNELLKEKTVKSLEDMKKGIVLFYQDGCPRCSFVTTYMLDNDIDFKLIDTTSDEKNQILMWDLLRLEKPELKNITMPVVLVNGQVSYDIENLKGFSNDILKPFSGI